MESQWVLTPNEGYQAVVDYLVNEYGMSKNRFIVVGNGPKRAVQDGVNGSNENYRTTDFNLIEDGDKIAIGISGGKDSLTLLYLLSIYKKISPKKFDLVGISLDPGNGCDFSSVELLSKKLNIEYHIIPTDISNIVFNIKKENRYYLSNICFLVGDGGFYRSRFRSLEGMSKQSTGLFLCRSLQCFRTVFAPIPVVRIHSNFAK